MNESGSWTDLQVDDTASGARIRDELQREVDPRERAPLIQAELEVNEWRWPSLEEWRRVFAAKGEVPAMWEEVLIEEPPMPTWGRDEMALLKKLSNDARTLARGADGAFKLSERMRRFGWERERCESTLEELSLIHI